MRRIPKSFQLLGHTITVRIVSVRDWEALVEAVDDDNNMDEADLGYWIPGDDLIVLKRQPKAQLMHTFTHELTHAILYYMNCALWTDEVFVDNFGGLLAQAMDTAKP
jgi:hypothetical protein